jgi:methyl-accepting chemotaxis protein
MALVKKSKIITGANRVVAPGSPPQPEPPTTKPSARGEPPRARHDTVAERIASATEQLTSGLAESAAATRELGKSMEQIAAGAEEAAGASQEQFVAIKRIVAALREGRSEAEASARRTDTVAASLTETSTQLSVSLRAIERGARRQIDLVDLIVELDLRAKEIGGITRAVSRISDQTNLLALNAAIEAARAGEQGRGFAVVADEVRTLAETSDKSAREVQQLTESIQTDVAEVGGALRQAAQRALSEAQVAASVAEALAARRDDMTQIAEGSRNILSTALEAERAAAEAQKGAEQIASAAEEQSSGAAESQAAVEQQAKALEQGRVAAQGLAALADDLRAGQAGASAIEQISASAEELSASIQELSGAASEVMAAVEQINRASQLQSSATHQTHAAFTQIENSAKLAQQMGRIADDRVRSIDAALKDSRRSIVALVEGVSEALAGARTSVQTVKRLETVGRKIEKIVEAIALGAVQTSMLAVSGAVEAARAGDSGQGFAVVSNDIRSLSREASENVERAKDTVRGILDQIAALRTDLEQIIGTADVEVQNNLSVSTGLQDIEKEVAVLGVASKSILEGADSILAATAETTKAARQIAAAAEEASAATRQAATAATQQSRGVEDLAAAIEEIALLADELKKAT